MIYLRSKKYSHLPNINGYLCLRCHWLLFYFVSVQASHRREPIPLISLWVLLDFLPISSNKSLHYRELNLDKFNITLCRNHVWLDKNPTFPDRNSISRQNFRIFIHQTGFNFMSIHTHRLKFYNWAEHQAYLNFN